MSFIKAADLGKKVLDDYNAAMEAKDMQEKAYYEKMAERQTEALRKAMKQTIDDACNKVEGYKDLPPLEQEFIKRMAVANLTMRFGGFNKKDKNT